MEIPQEELIELKKQIISQINSTFPEDKKAEAVKQIESMDENQFMEFLKQNNLIKSSGESGEGGKCIFCSIVFGDVPSTKIGENEKAIAILEINPISKGHSLIIPKIHFEKEEDLDQETESLARQIAERLKEKLSPKDVQIIPGNVMGHQILNILPIYGDESLESPRTKTTPEEIENLQQIIGTEELEETSTTHSSIQIEKIDSSKMWLPKRIP